MRFGFLAGLVAGAAVLAASALLRVVLSVPIPAELMWDFAVGKLPGTFFSAALDSLRYAAKPLFLAGLILLQLLAAGLLGTAYGLLGVAAALAAGVALEGPGAWAPLLAALLPFALLQALLLARLDSPTPERRRDGVLDTVRRDLLWKGVVGLTAVAAGGTLAKALSAAVSGGSVVARPPAAKLSSYITPNDQFYRVSKNLSDPVIEARSWHLEIKGLVGTPLRLTLDELRSLPAVTQAATLECISNEVGGDLMGNAVWKGVPLRHLLRKADIAPRAIDVALHAADEYTDSIPVEKALDPATLLAYEMNGEALSPAHGFPVRLLVPGIYGMKNVKWLTAVEPVALDFEGFWQAQGWSDAAEIRTTSRIDVPRQGEVVAIPAVIGGVAFAGERGILRVEVSWDGGKSWRAARLGQRESPYSWVLWLLDWDAATEGAQTVYVRAADGAGLLQAGKIEPPFPNGASGYHEVTFFTGP